MDDSLHTKPLLHVSHDFRILKKMLKHQLFDLAAPPFQKKLVLLPDLKTKNRLMLHFLSHVDVVMGVDFMELGSGLQFLYHYYAGKTLHLPPLDLLTLHLLPLIKVSPSFAHYSEKKAYRLSEALAMEFLRYGKFGYKELDEWLAKKGETQKLWKEVFSRWHLPSQLLDLPSDCKKAPIEVHLFKFSFLPTLYHRFFEKIASFSPVHLYHFSPCKEFWTDILSEKQQLESLTQVPERQRLEWNALTKERPPLLAHYGMLVRRTFQFFEEADFPLDENYPHRSAPAFLNRIQNDIVSFQTPSKENLKADSSLLIHSSPSKWREVEVLYDLLLKLMHENRFKPSEVRIYAPDIAVYAPYISFIFGGHSSPFSFTFTDLPKNQESSFLQAFSDLLSLNKNRFKQEAVLKLFRIPAFRKAAQLSEKEVETFANWSEKSGVKWGIDQKHRKELLEGEEIINDPGKGTWEEAFSQLLFSFTNMPKERPIWKRPFLDFSESEVIGQAMATLRNLQKELLFLEQASFTLDEWSFQLRHLLSRYFKVSEEESFAYKWIEDKISLLQAKALPDATYSFFPIYHYLKGALEDKRGKKEAYQTDTLTFSSLKLGGLDHAEIVAVLGLDETHYPRLSAATSLRELSLKEMPKTQEEDRHLFLELLFAASSHLLLSYVNCSEEDGREQSPSILLQELLAALDDAYLLDGQPSSKKIVRAPPPFSFHYSYFTQKEVGDLVTYHAAKQYYAPPKECAPFIPEFLGQFRSSSQTDLLTISLSALSRFAKNPLRFYLNHTLGLYLDYKQKDETFALSPLTLSLLRKKMQTTSFEEAFKEADLYGEIPLGRFKEVAYLTVQEEERLLKFRSLLPQTLDVSFSLSIGKKKTAKIEGTLSDATEEGLLFHGEKKLSDLLKIWPQFLVFACHSKSKEKNLLLTKSGERLSFPNLDFEKALINYIHYFEKSLRIPAPCLPAWVDAFLERGPKELAKKITSTTDPYANLLFQRQPYSVEEIYKTWAPFLVDAVGPLKEAIET